jgi:N-acetylglucosaminyldiphosphoundecaprenol N-acetyl-beta-D-mannosaminyltransferase
MTATKQTRANVLGVGISALNMNSAVAEAKALLNSGGKGYICVTGVHGIMEAQSDPAFRAIQNRSFLTTPDGMPTVWVGRLQGHKDMARVYGPDFMLALCQAGVAEGYRHFLYGGQAGVAEQLRQALTARIPGLQIAGTFTPPFRPLNEEEEAELYRQVKESRADILWCGLSTPKQERFMAQYLDRLPVKLMVGVGAAFDINSGRTVDAPAWIKKSGLQWLHRLLQEPRRLWRRYLYNNPRFLSLLLLQFTGLRRYEI